MGRPVNYYGDRPVERPPHPPHTRIGWLTGLALTLAVLLVATVAVLNLVSVDKVIYRPAGVHDTLGEMNGDPVVHVEGLETYETTGSLDFLTIIIDGGPRSRVTAWDWLLAELNPATDVFDTEDVYPPNVTSQEIREQNVELMSRSQLGAAVVALREIGIEVPEQVKVAQVIVDAPADGTLQVNDQIVSVADTPISNPEDVRQTLQDYEPGETVPFTIVRDGTEQTLEVPTGESEPDPQNPAGEPRTIIGVYLASDFDLPYEVTIDAGNVGGPSAGMMFSLAIYDKLTPGPLTGGLDFAGTGTIQSDGTVGPIGGIVQKMFAAEDAGVDYFLAPADNCSDVVGRIPGDLNVIKVGTFNQARDVIEALGQGEDIDLPRCS